MKLKVLKIVIFLDIKKKLDGKSRKNFHFHVEEDLNEFLIVEGKIKGLVENFCESGNVKWGLTLVLSLTFCSKLWN